MSWADLSPEQLELQYNPRLSVADFQVYLDDYADLCRETWGELEARRDIRYGARPLETLDYFPAAAKQAPLHVFYHGGYWRSLDKANFSFVARDLVPQGFNVAVVNYDLCPAVTVETIAREVKNSLKFLAAESPRLQFDREKISISGHSAGGQMVAQVLADESFIENDLPVRLYAAVAVSGVFDLQPLVGTSINDDVRLTAEQIVNHSPMYRPMTATVPLWVTVGANESAEFRRQSAEFVTRQSPRAKVTGSYLVPDSNHFSVLNQLYLQQGNSFEKFLTVLRLGG